MPLRARESDSAFAFALPQAAGGESSVWEVVAGVRGGSRSGGDHRTGCGTGYRQGGAGVLCAVPDEGKPARRLQEVQAYSTMTGSLLRLADRLHCLGVTRVVKAGVLCAGGAWRRGSGVAG